jgi:hypothetical protein
MQQPHVIYYFSMELGNFRDCFPQPKPLYYGERKIIVSDVSIDKANV